MNEEDCMSSGDHGAPEIAREVSRRRFAKAVIVALGVASFAGAGLSGALASHGSDDDMDFAPSGGSAASGGSGGSGSGGWEDDWVFSGSSGSGGSGGSGWDDDWDDDDWDDD
jgi:hypothetical protein